MKIDWTKVKEGFTTMDVLKEENKKLKEKIEILKSRLEEYQEYVEINHKEIERLNNIIDELEKYLIEQVEKSYSNDYDNVLDKLDELKGDDKD